eukprot:1162131-Pelagomonas_calceolata.AAC.21
MDHMRFGPAYSPLARVTAARWLFYPHLRLQRDFGGSSAAQAAAGTCSRVHLHVCVEWGGGDSSAAKAAAVTCIRPAFVYTLQYVH